jgi:superfamily I DNA/RNA helicase
MGDLFETILSSRAPRICVIAAPGSGKTKRILLPKARQILSDETIDPESVLLLSFSRLSAMDLKKRLQEALPRTPRASTVHAYCLAFLLSENNHSIRERIDSILLDFEKRFLICDLRLQLPAFGKRELGRMLDAFAAGWATRPHDQVFEEDDNRRAFKAAVLQWLSEHRAAMMEEVVHHAVSLARQLPESRLIDAPQYILVDEYQDLNQLEQAFVEALARRSRLLLAVGDPDQSIYSFKYAHPSGIGELAEHAETYRHGVTGRCPQHVVEYAAQLLRQASPGRTDLLTPGEEQEEGEVHFVRKQTQETEFEHVFRSVVARLKAEVIPKEIVILAPRKMLAADFAEYARVNAAAAGVPEATKFAFVQRPEFSDAEQERILLLGLLVKPDSRLRIRSYLGVGDPTARSAEVWALKDRYHGLLEALRDGQVDQIPRRNTRLRAACERLVRIREFLATQRENANVDALLAELFPEGDPQLAGARTVLISLREEGDTVESLYGKFVDYMRNVPSDDNTVRTMTLMASKGLDADHVYIIGCNSGNLPGRNRSAHLSDEDHLLEQRRLLYVGFTRARECLTVSWSRLLPFEQAQRLYTTKLGVVTRNGRRYARVGLCEFLQDLTGITWET